MPTTRCPHCLNDLTRTNARTDCPTCALAPASVGAVASRDYRPAAALPAAVYDVALEPTEVVAATFRMWSRDWASLVLIAAIPLILSFPFAGAAVATLFAMSEGLGDSPSAMIGLVGGGVIFSLLFTLVSLATFGATMALVDDREQAGRQAFTMSQALLVGLARSGRLFVGTAAVLGVLALAGAAAFGPFLAGALLEEPAASILALPGMAVAAAALWLSLRLAPLCPILVVEELSVVASFRRSFQLTRDRTGAVLGSGLLFGLVMFGLALGAGVLGIVPPVFVGAQLALNLVVSSLIPTFQLALYAALVNRRP